MKPFSTIGSEIGKVRERVRRVAESLHPMFDPLSRPSAGDEGEARRSPGRDALIEQRDRLLAKLGEQTFRLIAQNKLKVPKSLRDSVEHLAATLGIELPALFDDPGDEKSPTLPSDEPERISSGRKTRRAKSSAKR